MSNSNTVASLPKILQNNSKSAEKRIWLAGKIGGRTSAVLEQKQPKTGRKNMLCNTCISVCDSEIFKQL
jgi:hypothetical protein